jgi:hypothetical protein
VPFLPLLGPQGRIGSVGLGANNVILRQAFFGAKRELK